MKNLLNYILAASCFLSFVSTAKAQRLDTVAIVDYIKLYKDIAVAEMNRTGIPASITLAQGIHESGFGKSYLAQNTNNHFGIKCKENWTGKTFKYTDDAPNECFRVYDKVEDSYKDHSDFLKNRPRYAALFLLDKKDYKGWAYGLKKAGYATNPKYPEILIKLIEGFQLTAFDNGQIPPYLNTLKQNINVENADDTTYNVTDSLDIDISNTTNTQQPKTINTPTNIISPTQPTTTKKISKNIFEINKCKAVKIYKGETLDLLSNVLNKEKEDLLTYNDITEETPLKDGQTIFIQSKKKSNKEGTYKVKPEDNMWSISQKKGIRLASLLKINKLQNGEEPAVKTIISLKKKLQSKPELRTINTIKEPKIASLKNKINTIVRARDTIYPPIQEKIATESHIDSNKILDWESDTKLLEKSTVVAYPTKDSIVKATTTSTTIITTTTPVVEATTPTVYPKVIDYTKLPKSTTGWHTVVKGDTMYNICKRYNISIQQLMEWNNLTDQSVKLGQQLKVQ